MQDVFAAAGLGAAQVNQGLEGLNAKLNDARRNSNDLSELFEANGRKIKDAAGNAIPLQQALVTIADLIRNAATEQDKIDIAKLAGLSREWVSVLEKGGPALQSAQKAAQAVAPDVQRLIDKAAEFDQAWTTATANVGRALKGMAADFMGRVALGADLVLKRLEGVPYDKIMEDRRAGTTAFGFRAPGTPFVPPTPAGASTRDPNAPITVMPSRGGRGGSGAAESADEIERLVKASERLTDVKEAEIAASGKSNIEQQRAIGLARLEAAEREAGRKATEEETAAILRAAEARGRAADQTKRLRDAIELQNSPAMRSST
jgi:hypothetical protein